MPKKTELDHYSDKEALDFHIKGKSGKIEIGSSKPLTTKRDLSLAYSPGVAAPVKEISNQAKAQWANALKDMPNKMAQDLNKRGYDGSGIIKTYISELEKLGHKFPTDYKIN